MEWWNSFVAWLAAVSTEPVIFSAVVFVVAIVVASVLAAWISRGAMRRVLDQRDNEIKAAAIAALVDAATEASVWNSLTPQEQVMSDRAVGQADIQVRLLPIKGAAIAANWAAHQLGELKRTSATFGYQLEPALVEFRDRLVDWRNKPARARRIFQGDLERWKLQNSPSESGLIAEQDAWVAQQHHDQYEDHDQYGGQESAPIGVGYEAITAAPLNVTPAGRTPVGYTPDTASLSTETQRLLDDVDALEVDHSDPLTRTGSGPTS